MSNSIEGVVRESAREQVTMHKVEGGVWIVLGALFFLLAVFVHGKDDEQTMRVVAGVLGVLMVTGGVAYIKVMSARMATLITLLLHRRAELNDPVIVAIRRRGVVVHHAITVRDASRRRYRMRVPSEAAARAILAAGQANVSLPS